MRTLTLQRLEQNDFATYGQITDEEQKALCVDLELPWKDNQHDVSCIPAGTYHVKRRLAATTRHGYDVFELQNVPDRGDVQMHIGCLPRDTDGCILFGTAFGWVDYADGRPGARGHGVTRSKDAYDAFMHYMTGIDEFMLAVKDVSAAAVAASDPAVAPAIAKEGLPV